MAVGEMKHLGMAQGNDKRGRGQLLEVLIMRNGFLYFFISGKGNSARSQIPTRQLLVARWLSVPYSQADLIRLHGE